MPNYLTLVKPWTTGPLRELLKTRMFTIHSRRSQSAQNPTRSGDFVEITCPQWVNVIAITPDQQVVMIEQYRHGLAEVTLEIPGGIAEPGESPDISMARELLEETGYGGQVELIGKVSANPALQNNWVHTGLIRNATIKSKTQLDEHEEIAIRLVPLTEIDTLIRRGIIHHAFVVAAFMHLKLASD